MVTPLWVAAVQSMVSPEYQPPAAKIRVHMAQESMISPIRPAAPTHSKTTAGLVIERSFWMSRKTS